MCDTWFYMHKLESVFNFFLITFNWLYSKIKETMYINKLDRT